MRLKLLFSSLNNDQSLTDATKEYQDIWEAEGDKIIDAIEHIGQKPFSEGEIMVTVYEGVSKAGKTTADPMMMRASYSHEVKIATLIHELGHRYLYDVRKNPLFLDGHQVLFLILYDIWVELYGVDFANRNVAVESGRKGIYTYEEAWIWALKLTRLERAELYRQVRGVI